LPRSWIRCNKIYQNMRKIILIAVAVLCVCTATAWAGQNAYNVSSLCLNSLSYDIDQGQQSLAFGVAAAKSGNYDIPINIQKSTERAIEYFFMGLVLPDDAFWVDLNPAGLTQIMERDIADTDMGRVLLAADLRLKKDTSELTNPQRSKTGREYWDRLYAKADALGIVDQIPVCNRVWIVPDEASLSIAANQITIVESSLKVCFAADVRAAGFAAVDAKTKQLQEYAGQLMRELILPGLTKKVNESSAYADLRQVYNALILARQYKLKLNEQNVAGNSPDARAVLMDVEKNSPLDKNKIYQNYLTSLRRGEYNIQEEVSGKLDFYMEIVTRQYMSGGIDLRKVRIKADGISNARPQGVINYSFGIVLPAGISRPLAAAKEQLAQRFAGYNIVRTVRTAAAPVLSVDNLPAVKSLELMLGQHLNSVITNSL
jgi:hypothetical protein